MKLRDLKFTPPPWRVQTKEEFHLTEDNYHSIVAGNGFFEDEDRGFNLTSYITNDDALLISRAPEMLEKLKKAEDALNELFNLIDSGVLVRDISKDHLPEYTINALKLTLKLKDVLTTKTEITDLLNS